MRTAGLLGIALVFACGMVLAGGGGTTTSDQGKVAGKRLVEFEGVMVTPSMAKKLEQGGYHRYLNQWETHNAHALQREIDKLNLLNGIFLSEVQMRHLMNVAIKAEKIRRKYKDAIDRVNAEMEAALTGLKKDLLAGKERSASPYNGKVKAAQKKMHEIRKAMNRELVVCETYAKAILTPNQREVVYTYEHCLIPVRALTNKSAKVGQADASTKSGELLDKIRKMSDEEFAAKQEQLVSDHFHSILKYCGDMTDAQRAKERANFLNICKKARSLSELEYQFQKSQLAAQLPNDYDEVKERLKAACKNLLRVESERGDGRRMGAIGQMLLDPDIIPILGRRLKIYADWQNMDRVDLDALDSQACLNGSCAID